MEICAILVCVGVLLLGIGAIFSGGLPKCDGCGGPQPDGFECIDQDLKLCRACTRRFGLPAWYEKGGK